MTEEIFALGRKWVPKEQVDSMATVDVRGIDTIYIDPPQSPTFRRQIDFHPGYNYLHEKGPSRRGQHGMEIAFLLHGPHGSTVFRLSTGWTPLGEVDADKTIENGYHREAVHIDHWQPPMFNFKSGLVRPPMGTDLGMHWRTPLYDGMYESNTPCQFIGEPKCYYDGSGLQADEVLHKFIKDGSKPVWQALVQRYRDCLEMEKGMAE